MKTGKLGMVLALCGIILLLLSNRPFLENETLEPLTSPKVLVPFDQSLIPKTKHTVIVKGMTFDPVELHVRKGDTIVWINKDIVPHNVTEFPENKWTSGTLVRNASWEKITNKTFNYYCSIHPTMKGKIVVDP